MSASKAAARARLLVVPVLAATALASSSSALASAMTFTPGGEGEYAVPAGVTQVEVTAIGGAGEAGGECLFDGYRAGSQGGAGAKARARIAVGEAHTLYVRFGGGGSGGPASGCIPGGGAGGDGADVRSEPSSLASRLIVAGGGGGGGSGDAAFLEIFGTFGGAGGSGSEASGSDGLAGMYKEFGFVFPFGGGGQGGGQALGGTGGSGSGCGGAAGQSGAEGSGGAGGAEGSCAVSGGGGGGWFGGGGGGGSNNAGGGGGAGSSYVEPGAQEASIVSGASEAEGVVIAPVFAPEATIASPHGGGVYALGATVQTAFQCAEGEEGPGLQSCQDSAENSEGAGTLDTSAVGRHTYTVTATSADGQSGRATIEYTVAAPATTAAPTGSPAPAPLAQPPAKPAPTAAKACTSQRRLMIHIRRHLAVPTHAKIQRVTVLLDGDAVTTVRARGLIAPVSLVGKGAGTFTIELVAQTSTGRTLTSSIVVHTCTPSRRS